MKVTSGVVNVRQQRINRARQCWQTLPMKDMTQEQVAAWVDANVKTLADARTLLKHIVVALLVFRDLDIE